MSIAVYHVNMSLRKFVRSVKQTMRLYALNADIYRAEFSLPLPVSLKAPTGRQLPLPGPVAHVPAALQQPAVTVINHKYRYSCNTCFRYPFSPQYDKR